MELARKGIADDDFGDGQREIAEWLMGRISTLEALISKDPITGFVCCHCKKLNEFTFTADGEVKP